MHIIYIYIIKNDIYRICLLYTSDAADDLLCVDLGGRRIIKKKKLHNTTRTTNTVENILNTYNFLKLDQRLTSITTVLITRLITLIQHRHTPHCI